MCLGVKEREKESEGNKKGADDQAERGSPKKAKMQRYGKTP